MHGLRTEFAEFERFTTPILLGASLQILFSFAFGGAPDSAREMLFIGSTVLTILLSTQVAFARVFEPDTENQALDIMRATGNFRAMPYIGARITQATILVALVCIPVMALGMLFDPQGASRFSQPALLGGFVLLIFGAIVGLSSLGVLLSLVTIRGGTRQVLFPLLFFPLATPVLLAAIQGSFEFVNAGAWQGSAPSWLGLVAIFDAIYLTLSILLASELLEQA